jgi:hypothetical protein
MNRFIFCLCVLVPSPCSALGRAGDVKPQRDNAAIEKVVAGSMEAARKGDWKRYAELVHPESLKDYKSMWLPLMQAAAKEGQDKQADLLRLFDEGADLKSLMALEPKAFFVSSMKGMASQTTVSKPDAAKSDEKILGTVREGKDLAHVLIRTHTRYQQIEVNKLDVVTVKRSDTRWKIVLPEGVRVMAETFRHSLGPATLKSGSDTVPADPRK